MFIISLNEEYIRHFLTYCLSFYLIKINRNRLFSDMAADHWCLSLTEFKVCLKKEIGRDL